ncbi:hypothetical protein [Streptomyces sp. ATCC 21386]|nr:hypothetical protein [Streptomyces sp. ATCC 21386]
MLPADITGRDACGRVGGFCDLLASWTLVRDRLTAKEPADAPA